MAFQKFEQKLKSKNKFQEPVCAIGKEGLVTFNKAAITRYKLDSGCEYVSLYFDDEKKRLGIKKEPNANSASAKIISSRANRGKAIGVRRLLKEHNCLPTQRMHYPVTYFVQGNLIVVDLRKKVT